MIISRTPFRISFFGGGTDYPTWYREEGGAVLSTTIDKYCYITCRYLPPFFLPVRHRIVWSKIELPETWRDIAHPAVRAGFESLGLDDEMGVEIHHQGDLPARSGMGSSSTFAVGLLKALHGLKGKMMGKMELAKQAIHLEQHLLNEQVGCQDQIAAAFGGMNVIHFAKNDEFRVEPVVVSQERLSELNSHLMLMFTGTSRTASEVAKDVVSNMGQKKESLRTMRTMVDQALQILTGEGSLNAFGELLHQAWLLKRGLSEKVSNSTVDTIYETARQQGAIGGKLLGAGSSGFMLFFVPPHSQEKVRSALKDYLHVPFSFENEGSNILYYRPETSS